MAVAAPPAQGAWTEGLPVELSLAGTHAVAVRTWVEGVVGWQAVDRADPLVPPLLVLADVAGRQRAPGDLPVVVLVCAEDPPVRAAAAAIGAVATVAWPDDRDRLIALAGEVISAQRDAVAPIARDLRVAGAAGGVGTTTVALALAGLHAWRGVPTLVLGHGAIPTPTGAALAVEDLAGARTWEVASAVAGVPRLKVVRLVRPPADEALDAGAARAVVRDLGVSEDGDVLVLRRDAAGLHALARSAAAVAIVVDDGVATPRAVRAAAEGRRLVVVEWSHRVARAGLAGRVPAGLPGRWLRALARALDGAPA